MQARVRRIVTTATVAALNCCVANPLRSGSFTMDRDSLWNTLRDKTSDKVWADAVAWWISRVIVYAPTSGLEIRAEAVSEDGTWVTVMMEIIQYLRGGILEDRIATAIRELASAKPSVAADLAAGAAHTLCVALATCTATHHDLVKATHAMDWACRNTTVSPYLETTLAQSITMAHSLDVDRRQAPLLGLWEECRATGSEDTLLDGLASMGAVAATYPEFSLISHSPVMVLGPAGEPVSMSALKDIDPTPTHDDEDMMWVVAVAARLVTASRTGDARAVADVLAPVSTVPQRLSMIEMMARLIRDRLAEDDRWLTPQ
jgi:hypothetical protein